MTMQTMSDHIAKFLASQIVVTSTTKTSAPETGPPVGIRALIHGDNRDVLHRFHRELQGAVDLIYIDPPFATSNEFRAGESAGSTMSAPKDWALAYSDTFTLDGYLDFLKPRIAAMRDTLSDVGSFYIHTDVKVGHYVKVLIDEVFGRQNFRNEITRIKCNPKNFGRKGYGNIKDTILFYTKGNDYIWNEPRVEPEIDAIMERYNKTLPDGRRYTTTPLHAPGETTNGATGEQWRGMSPPAGRHWSHPPTVLEQLDRDGVIEWSSTGNPRKIMFADDAVDMGIKMQDVWTFKDPQRSSYPTEKNLEMLETIVRASSQPDSLVLDAFCGSGTMLLAASNLGRNFIGIDESEAAIRASTSRLRGKFADLDCQMPSCVVCPEIEICAEPTLF